MRISPELLGQTPDCDRLRAGIERNLVRTARQIAELMALKRRMTAALDCWGGFDCSNPLCAGCCAPAGKSLRGRRRA